MDYTSNGCNGISNIEDFYKNKNNQQKTINTLPFVENNNAYINTISRNEGALGSRNPTLFLTNEVEDEDTGSQTNLYEPTSEKPKEKPKKSKVNKIFIHK